MSAANQLSQSLPRVELRGLERFMTWSPEICFKLVHTMLLEGSPSSVQAFAPYIAEALMHTFNRHPRMRIKLLPDEFAVGVIHPKLTVQDIHDQKLLHIKTIHTPDEMSESAWQAFVQEQVEIPFDRIRCFSFELHVWMDKASGIVRLFLFSDHSLSDGNSGNTILNDVLSIASALACGGNDLARLTEEQPLQGSIYQQSFGSRKVLRPVLSAVLRLLSKALFKTIPPFVPLIKPRAGHQRFTVPPPINASTLLFGSGSSESLKVLLQRCREEKTTFFGALMAATLLSFAIVSDAPREKKLQLTMNFAIDVRATMKDPVAPGTVGFYALAGTVEELMADGGVDLATVGFWEAARAMKQEAHASKDKFVVTSLPVMMLDQSFHSQTPASFFKDTYMTEYASGGDVSISTLGRYAHATTHGFTTEAETVGELVIQSVHYNLRSPFTTPLTQLYVTSVPSGGINYGLNHHLEPAVGKQILDSVMQIMEQAWRITSNDSLAQAIDTLRTA